MNWTARAAVTLAPLSLVSCNMDSSPALESATTGMADSGAEVVPARQALTRAYLPATDLETMNEAELTKVIEPGPHCSFAYTSTGNPVFVTAPADGGSARGVIKVHGSLVELSGSAARLQTLEGGGRFGAEGLAIAVQPRGEARRIGSGVVRREADLLFRLEEGLEVGYGGFYSCSGRGLPNVE